MKISFLVSVATAALSLVLAIIVLIVGFTNHSLQTEIQGQQKEIQKQQAEIQKQQEEINKGNSISQQVGPNLLRDMAVASLKNEKMKTLLGKHGYNVQQQATPAPGTPAAPASAPADSTEVPGLR